MELTIDKQTIVMNVFVQTILQNVLKGVLVSLDDIPENAHKVSFILRTGTDVELYIDDAAVRMNAFVCTIVSNVLLGCVTSLDGVSPNPQNIQLDMVI